MNILYKTLRCFKKEKFSSFLSTREKNTLFTPPYPPGGKLRVQKGESAVPSKAPLKGGSKGFPYSLCARTGAIAPPQRPLALSLNPLGASLTGIFPLGLSVGKPKGKIPASIPVKRATGLVCANLPKRGKCIPVRLQRGLRDLYYPFGMSVVTYRIQLLPPTALSNLSPYKILKGLVRVTTEAFGPKPILTYVVTNLSPKGISNYYGPYRNHVPVTKGQRGLVSVGDTVSNYIQVPARGKIKSVKGVWANFSNYHLETLHRSNQDTCLIDKALVKEGEWVQSGDLLADSASSIGGELSIGHNIIVAYMPWEGFNYEDAILINQRLVYEDVYTSIHIERYETSTKNTKLGPEQITRHIPDISQEETSHLDKNGIAQIGSPIQEGSILVGKVTPFNLKAYTSNEKFLFELFDKKASPTKDSSLRAPKGIKAHVIQVNILARQKVQYVLEKDNKKKIKGSVPNTPRGLAKTPYQPLTPLGARYTPKGDISTYGENTPKGRKPFPVSLSKRELRASGRKGFFGLPSVTRQQNIVVTNRNRVPVSYYVPLKNFLPKRDKDSRHPWSKPSQGFLPPVFLDGSYVPYPRHPHRVSNPIRYTPKGYLQAFGDKAKGPFGGSNSGVSNPSWSSLRKLRTSSSVVTLTNPKGDKLLRAKGLCLSRRERQDTVKHSVLGLVFPVSLSRRELRASGPFGVTKGLRGIRKPKGTFLQPSHVHIYLAEKRKVQVGDKLSGRHGNKGIVSRISPRQDMPFLPDGTPVDIVLNPLGVPSRMNVGQIYECLLGLAGRYLGEHYKIPPFDEIYGPEASRSFVFSKLYQARKKTGLEWIFDPNTPGKTRLFDGRTSQLFDQTVSVGISYILKLVHMVDDKLHARSVGPYSLVTQQPLRGRSKQGGQRLGEMEVWAIEGYGAAFVLSEMLTIKSDNLSGRRTLWVNLINNKEISLGTPESFKVLVCELQALCLDICLFRQKSPLVSNKNTEGGLDYPGGVQKQNLTLIDSLSYLA